MATASWDATLGNTIDLRNLNLAPGASVTFTMTNNSPCSGGSYTWGISAKQSNDYNGSGNDFTLDKQKSTLNTSQTSHCALTWSGGTEPASAFKGSVITDTPYSLGSAVKVRLVDTATSQTVTTATGTVTLSPQANTCSPATSNFTGNTATLSGGFAAFGNLIGNDIATGCRLIASDTTDGYTSSGPSTAFDISYGTSCANGICPTTSGTIDGSSKLDAGATGAFTFLAFNASSIPSSVTDPTGTGGCAGFQSVYSADPTNPVGGVFNETDSGATGQTTKTFRYYINKKLVQKKFGNNSGQQFIPICAGGQRLGTDGKPVDCNIDKAKGGTGWMGKKLDPATGQFNGQYGPAVCDQDGLWWGILTSFQDNNSGAFDPATTPTVTGWNSDTTYRWFDISVPNPWDWRAGT